MGRGAGEALEDGSDNAEPSLPLQEQCITFDRVLGSDAAQVGGVVGKREEAGNPQASGSWSAKGFPSPLLRQAGSGHL